MIECTEIIFENDIAKAYKLEKVVDGQIRERLVNADKLEKLMIDNKIQIENLELDSENKIRYIVRDNYLEFINKAKILNRQIEELSTLCNHTCYLIQNTNNDYNLYLPDTVTMNHNVHLVFSEINADKKLYIERLHELRGTIHVIGGRCVEMADSMFTGFGNNRIKIDLTRFKPNNIKSVSNMFSCSSIEEIKFPKGFGRTVTNMTGMFYNCDIEKLDLSNFDTSNVERMSGMFCDSTIKLLNVSSFNTKKVKNMRLMFSGLEIDELDLSNFDTSNVENMQFLFSRSTINKLDISHFSTESIQHLFGIFDDFYADSVYITDKKLKEEYNKTIISN